MVVLLAFCWRNKEDWSLVGRKREVLTQLQARAILSQQQQPSNIKTSQLNC